MHGLVLLAVFGFCVVLGLAIASRRPLLALLALLAGAGWPVTLFPPKASSSAPIVLAAALWLLAALRVDRPTPALAAGALVVVAAAAISTSAAFAKGGVLDWTRWEPYGLSGRPVSVDFVWDANYGGIDFPSRETTVLRIRGPGAKPLLARDDARPLHRGSLDREPAARSRRPGRRTDRSPRDPLLPRRAAERAAANWTRQEVEIVALADEHLVAREHAGRTRRGRPRPGRPAHGRRAPTPGRRCSAGSATPSRATRRGPSRPSSPRIRAGLSERERATTSSSAAPRVQPFGTAGRRGRWRRSSRTSATCRSGPTRGSTARPSGSPPARAGRTAPSSRSRPGCARPGGFSYDEQPPAAGGVPPLAYFVDEGRRGYCQHFAGAMALMLRFLGIPTRIAAGFTSGHYAERRLDGDRPQRPHLGRGLVPAATAGSRSTRRRGAERSAPTTAPRRTPSTPATRPTVAFGTRCAAASTRAARASSAA